MSEDLRVKYNTEIRKQALEMFEEGAGGELVASTLGIAKATAREWWRKFQVSGAEGVMKVGGSMKKYSFETRLAVAHAVVDEGITKLDAMKKFNITSLSSVKRWCRIYREQGAEALRPKESGRPLGRKNKKKTLSHEEELEERIRYLETENAYLKKSIALKAQRNLQTTRKPKP